MAGPWRATPGLQGFVTCPKSKQTSVKREVGPPEPQAFTRHHLTLDYQHCGSVVAKSLIPRVLQAQKIPGHSTGKDEKQVSEG